MDAGTSGAAEEDYEYQLIKGEVTIDGEICPTNVYVRRKKKKKSFKVDVTDIGIIGARYNEHLWRTDVYQISHTPKGKVFLLNNEFRNEECRRIGSKLDVENMKTVWEQLNCEVIVEQNLTSDQIKSKIAGFLNGINENTDFCAIFAMSHGEIGDILVGNEGTRVHVKEILHLFSNMPKLNGKPKLLFFQMCRGTEARRPDNESLILENRWLRNSLQNVFPEGRLVNAAVDVPETQPIPDSIPTTVRFEYVRKFPDMMVSFATMPGEMAFRNKDVGSWFIDAIATVYCAKAKNTDALEMMKEVRENVYRRRANCPDRPEIHGCTSLCEISETLDKKLYFYPGIKP